MSFRLTDGSTFLRVHKPKMYGDKLNKKRKIILDTISTQKRQCGFEVGKLKMTYRVVTPIFYNNELVGVVEIGIEPEFITQRINKVFSSKSGLVIKKDFKSISLDKTQLKQKGDWILARGDNIFHKHFEQINLDGKNINLLYNNILYFLDNNLNLYDNHNKITAKLIVAFSIQKYTEQQNAFLIKNILILLISFIIIGILLNYGFNFYIKMLEKAHKDLEEQNKNLEKR